jgi:hypothetical protein
MAQAPHIKRIWVSKTNSSITAESAEAAEVLRLANPGDSDYQFWIETKELDLCHEYEDETPGKPSRNLNNNEV